MWLANQAGINWHWQPALLLELAQRYQINDHALLSGSRIFVPHQGQISPRQWLRLCDNAQRLAINADFGFRYGQRLLPNAFGNAGLVVHNATQLGQAIEAIIEHSATLMPLFAPRRRIAHQQLHIEWFEPFGLSKAYRLLTQAYFSSWVNGLNQLSQQRLPFQAQVNLSAADEQPLWHSFVSTDIHFDQAVNRLSLPVHCLELPLPQGSVAGYQYAQQQAKASPQTVIFTTELYQRLHQTLPHLPDLDQLCRELKLSRATVKRYLALAGLSFRQLCDRVRFDEAMRLQHSGDCSTDEMAAALAFYDTSNFRRALNRWRMQFLHGAMPSAN